jgi:hypothetical protein
VRVVVRVVLEASEFLALLRGDCHNTL